jgi:hypothetical protein
MNDLSAMPGVAISIASGVIALSCFSVASAQTTVTDSAGVRIVTNSGPAPGPPDIWSISERPAVTLGGLEGDMWQIRDYIRLPDGRIAVLSAGTSDVRVFDAAETELASLGRSGRGPGELEFPIGLTFVAPDTILVLDRGAIEVFLLDGTFVRSEPAPVIPNGLGEGVSGRPVAVTADRSMLLVGAGTFDIRHAVRTGAIVRPPEALGFVVGPDEPPRRVGSYPGIEQQVVDLGTTTRVVVPPFARQTIFGLGPTPEHRFYAADNARREIHIYDEQGSLRRILRREAEPISVRGEWIEDWKERQRGRRWTRSLLPVLERAWSRMHVPETLPPFEDAVFDSEGYLWIRRPNPEWRAPVVFEVFDSSGVLRGRVTVPGGITTRPRIGPESFVAVWEDALGVETVRVYELRR